MNYLEESGKWLGLEKDDIIDEATFLGTKIDKNKLDDEDYVKDLIKKIENTKQEDYEKRENRKKLFMNLAELSACTVIGIPVCFLFVALATRATLISDSESELKYIKSNISKVKNNLEKMKRKNPNEKEKIQKQIDKLEKNEDIIDKKLDKTKKLKSIVGDNNDDKNFKYSITRDIYIYTVIESVLDDIKNGTLHVEKYKNIIDNWKKEKYNNSYIFEDGLEQLSAAGFTNQSKMMKYLEANKTDYDDSLSEYAILDDKEKFFKDKHFAFIIGQDSDDLYYCFEDKCCYMIYHDDGYYKCTLQQVLSVSDKAYNDLLKIIKEYSIDESYNFKTGGISMNTINKLVSVSESYNIKNSNRLRNDIVSEYTETINSLYSIDESVIAKDIRVLPLYKIKEKKKAMKESYAIDLDSLKYVVQNEQCSLEEASNLLKRINNIDEDCSLYCVLPKNINENMSIESFINLNNMLNEAGIESVCIKDYNINEFINE